MKLDKLIKMLQDARNEHGNVEVVVPGSYGYYEGEFGINVDDSREDMEPRDRKFVFGRNYKGKFLALTEDWDEE